MESKSHLIYAWKYLDRPKHGYHLDAEDDSIKKLLNSTVEMLESGVGSKMFRLGNPPEYVKLGPNIGREPKTFKRLFILKVDLDEYSKKCPRILDKDNDLLLLLTLEQIGEFKIALEQYLNGDWDFDFGGISFWHYSQWKKEKP